MSFGTSKRVLFQIQVPFNAGATLSLGKLWSVPLPEEVTEAASFVKAASLKSPTGQRSRNCMQIGFPLSRVLGVKQSSTNGLFVRLVLCFQKWALPALLFSILVAFCGCPILRPRELLELCSDLSYETQYILREFSHLNAKTQTLWDV